jgi:hypothetical protein
MSRSEERASRGVQGATLQGPVASSLDADPPQLAEGAQPGSTLLFKEAYPLGDFALVYGVHSYILHSAPLK